MEPFATSLHADVHAFITRAEGSFDELALRVFAYQFEHNQAYRSFCARRGLTPDSLRDWAAIPAVPVTAFKHLALACRPVEDARAVFLSSGTTQGRENRSRHHVFDLRLYHAAIRDWFAAHLLPGTGQGEGMLTCGLMPSPADQPDSSLGHMLGYLVKEFGKRGSGFFLRSACGQGRFELEVDRLVASLREATEPVMLLGTSYAFVQFLDFCEAAGVHLRLPAGSRLMDTGGFKGRSREVTRDALYQGCRKALGIPPTHCVNEYGMAEMLSQFYDRRVGVDEPRLYRPPPWVRTLVLDPEALQPVAEGRAGMLRHWDLANVDSVMVLQTEDLGRPVGGGFELLGRAAQAEARGCSLLVEEWLEGEAGLSDERTL